MGTQYHPVMCILVVSIFVSCLQGGAQAVIVLLCKRWAH
jgi:hypothetical protein